MHERHLLRRHQVGERVEALQDEDEALERYAVNEEVQAGVYAREPEGVLDHVHDEQDDHAGRGFDPIGLAGLYERVEERNIDLINEELERPQDRISEQKNLRGAQSIVQRKAQAISYASMIQIAHIIQNHSLSPSPGLRIIRFRYYQPYTDRLTAYPERKGSHIHRSLY